MSPLRSIALAVRFGVKLVFLLAATSWLLGGLALFLAVREPRKKVLRHA